MKFNEIYIFLDMCIRKLTYTSYNIEFSIPIIHNRTHHKARDANYRS